MQRTYEQRIDQIFPVDLKTLSIYAKGSKGWCSGESNRLTPMWPGFKFPASTPYVGRVCCWFSLLL